MDDNQMSFKRQNNEHVLLSQSLENQMYLK